MRVLLALFYILILSACGGSNIEDNDEDDNAGGNGDNNPSSLCSSPQTTEVTPIINLGASEIAPIQLDRQLELKGADVAVAQAGLNFSTTTNMQGAMFRLPVVNNFSEHSMDFDITLTNPAENTGTVSIRLESASGVPTTVSTFNDLKTLVNEINNQISNPIAPQTNIDIVADAIDAGNEDYYINFSATQEGLASVIIISNTSANTSIVGVSSGLASTAGIPEVSNGYPSQAADITMPNTQQITYTNESGASAAVIASELNALQGITATARSQSTLSNFTSVNGNLRVSLNTVELSSASLADLATEINSLSNTTLAGFSAAFDSINNDLDVISATGEDLHFTINSVDDGDSLSVLGRPDSVPVVLEVDTNQDGVQAGSFDAEIGAIVVGGTVTIVLEEGYDIEPLTSEGLYQPLTPSEFIPIVINGFDPEDSATFNSKARASIYDSLGNEHELEMFFVKQNSTDIDNHWQMIVMIDGHDVGDPDISLAPPNNTVATRALFSIVFNEVGALDGEQSEAILISNWVPLDSNGEPNNAIGPQNILAGGSLSIASPPTSSNFVINIELMTQTESSTEIMEVQSSGASPPSCESDS